MDGIRLGGTAVGDGMIPGTMATATMAGMAGTIGMIPTITAGTAGALPIVGAGMADGTIRARCMSSTAVTARVIPEAEEWIGVAPAAASTGVHLHHVAETVVASVIRAPMAHAALPITPVATPTSAVRRLPVAQPTVAPVA